MTETLISGNRQAGASTSYRTKLIEVALPLEAINTASAREKSIRHGHPSTLHLWWARRPLAACRAVLFAQMVDDPSAVPEEFPTEETQEVERQRLFRIIEQLVQWENSTNETVLNAARTEIARSVARTAGLPAPETPGEVRRVLEEHAPAVLDPFCGGGSIPLEAQRLGLEAHASDLNPVAVLITKALIETPPKYANRPPVNPRDRGMGIGDGWKGAAGLAADVRYYGEWMREEARRQIGHLYPKVRLPEGSEATVIAWLWARTVTCPNPACGARMPLVRSFALSTKKGKEIWVEPVVDRDAKPPIVNFRITTGSVSPHQAAINGAGTGLTNDKGKKAQATFICVACGSGLARGEYIDQEASTGRMGAMPLAIVAEGNRGRVYVPFDSSIQMEPIEHAREMVASPDIANTLPMQASRGTFASNAQGRIYGFKTFADYFTPRQLVALTSFSDLVGGAREQAVTDARRAGMPEGEPLHEGGHGALAYGDAVATYLAFALDKCADYWNTIATWSSTGEFIRNCFARQAIPMTWDFAECNPFSGSTANVSGATEWVALALRQLPSLETRAGKVRQWDAVAASTVRHEVTVATDPPYYDNIGYADLSDFFYVWLRRSLRSTYPDLFRTMLVPKAQELIATPYRFEGSKQKAQSFFEEGLGKAFDRIYSETSPRYPVTIYYAFKQAESEAGDGAAGIAVASSGWDTMLTGLLRAGFMITGTWPMRTERGARSVGLGTNALASSIVLACRPRAADAPIATRREFTAVLRAELPRALAALQHGNIAPVDLAQASIGPGMAVFSRYSKVLEADGSPMSVRTALQIINQELDRYLAEQEGEMDADTRFCIAWYEQYGFRAARYGEAEVLAKAKNTSVEGLVRAGVLQARGGEVRLLAREELDPEWNPLTDQRLTDWECTQHLIRVLQAEGEMGAARLAGMLGGDRAQRARDLAYRLYSICDRKNRAEEAGPYNELVVSWPAILELAAREMPAQQSLI